MLSSRKAHAQQAGAGEKPPPKGLAAAPRGPARNTGTTISCKQATSNERRHEFRALWSSAQGHAMRQSVLGLGEGDWNHAHQHAMKKR